MGMVWDNVLRNQIDTRRERLQSAMATAGETERLVTLLREVESALERINDGSYGLCDDCRLPIEQERLIADPLVRVCLGCLSPEQQRALEADLDLAARIQGGLLPKPRDLDGWQVCFHYEPAGLVSGDYCDLVYDERDAGSFVFLVGDVSGKGVAASMLMSHLHAIFRSLTGLGLPVSRLVEQANRVFCESTIATHFATLVCGRANRSGTVEVCNAGHCPPLLVRNGETTDLEATGIPIGILADAEFTCHTFELRPGETLLLYTDGLSEAQSADSAEYGVERLAALARSNGTHTPQEVISACLDDLRAFCGPAGRRDDLTIMAVRRA